MSTTVKVKMKTWLEISEQYEEVEDSYAKIDTDQYSIDHRYNFKNFIKSICGKDLELESIVDKWVYKNNVIEEWMYDKVCTMPNNTILGT